MTASTSIRLWLMLSMPLVLPVSGCKPVEQPRALDQVIESLRFDLPTNNVPKLQARLESLAENFDLEFVATNHCPNRPCWSIFLMDERINIGIGVADFPKSDIQGMLASELAISLKLGVPQDPRIPELQTALRLAIEDSGGVSIRSGPASK
jgi:hypothetical protein